MTTETTRMLYTHPACSYSDALRHELVSDGVVFTEIDIAKQPEMVSEVLKLTGGERITPVMVEGEVVTVGYRGVG